MEIIITLKLDSPDELTEEEIERDLRTAEDQIGWSYCYSIKTIEVIK